MDQFSFKPDLTKTQDYNEKLDWENIQTKKDNEIIIQNSPKVTPMNESPSKQSLSHIENCDVKSSEEDIERLLDWHSKENPVDESTFWLSTEAPQTTTPLLFVDVNAGWGRIERVTIHQGDTPESLAE